MATITSVGSGKWSAAGTWDAGVPADGDTVVIAAGHTVEFDVDQSGFAAGLAGLTVTGTLAFTTAASTTTFLKMNANITGAGALYVGNSEADYIPRTSMATIELTSNYSIQVTTQEYHGWHPTDRNHTTLSQAALITATDIYLTDTLDVAIGEEILVAGVATSGNMSEANKGVYTVAAYDAGLKKITLTAGLNTARATGGSVSLYTRRCLITHTTTNDSPPITRAVTAYGARFEKRRTSSSAGSSTFSFCTFNSITYSSIWGSYNNATNCTNNVVVYAMVYEGWLNNASDCTCINMGSNGAIAYGGGYSTFKNIICENCINPMQKDGGVNSIFTNCSTLNTSGTAFQVGVLNSGHLATFINCTATGSGVGLSGAKTARLINCTFPSGAEYTNYNAAYRLHPYAVSTSINHNNVPGAYKSWTAGGVITSTAAQAPVGFTSSYLHALENASWPCWMDYPVMIKAGDTLKFTAYFRKDASMAYLPRVWLFEQLTEPLANSSYLLYEKVMESDVNDTWVSYACTYTNSSAIDKGYVIRLLGKNASDNLYTQLSIPVTAKGSGLVGMLNLTLAIMHGG